MSEEIDLEKIRVWFNKADLTTNRTLEILYKIKTITKFYGMCYLCSEDLSQKQLQRIIKKSNKLFKNELKKVEI